MELKFLPRGYLTLFLTLTLLMLGLTLIQSLLIPYVGSQLNFSEAQTYRLFLGSTTLLFALPLMGSYLGNKLLGYPLTVSLGLALTSLGAYLVGLGSNVHLYIGLACTLLGAGMTLCALFVLVSRCYQKDDTQRLTGFTTCYAGMNLAIIIGLALSHSLLHHWNYPTAFLISAITITIALLVFTLGIRHFLEPELLNKITNATSGKRPWIALLIIAIMTPVVSELLYFSQHLITVLLILAALALFYILRHIRHLTFLILMLGSLLFWAIYLLSPTLLKPLITHHIDPTLFGYTLSIPTYSLLNPLFVIFLVAALSPLRHKIQTQTVSSSMRFIPVGMVLMAAAYGLLSFGTLFASTQGLISALWVVLAQLLQAAAELAIFPIGAALISRLSSDLKKEGPMMSLWLFAISLGMLLSSGFAHLSHPRFGLTQTTTSILIYRHYFLEWALIALFTAFLTYLVTRNSVAP